MMNAEGKAEVNEAVVEQPTAEAQPAVETPAATPATPVETADVEALKAEAAKAKDLWDRLLRTTADYDNFKKRAARERQEAIKFANESLLEKLIPVLDNFEMALAATNNTQNNTVQSLQTGVNMIHQQLKRVLTEAGLEEVDATNQAFDPNVHEAVALQEAPNVPEGQVIQQMRKGYKLRERLLRPASVVVAKAAGS